MVKPLPRIYKSDRNNDLVSHIPGVITCENYCKWYNLYYIDNNGIVCMMSDLYDDFHNDVAYIDHSWEPKSLVEFAIKHKLYIGLESYKAICYMYYETIQHRVSDSCIPDDDLPTMKDLKSVLLEDYGDWSYCFSGSALSDNGFRFANDYVDNWNPISVPRDNILSYGPFVISRVNDYMYEVSTAEHFYMIDDLLRLGEAIGVLIEDDFDDTVQAEHERLAEIDLKKINGFVNRSMEPDYDAMIDKPDLLKYYVPSFIDVYKENGKFTDGMVVNFPLAFCRGQLDMRNNRKIPVDVYDKGVEEFNKLGNSRYLMINTTRQEGIFSKMYCNLSDAVGRIIGIGRDRIYVKIINANLLNNLMDEANIYQLSAGMRYLGKSVYDDKVKTLVTKFEEAIIICFDIVTREAGNKMYYFDNRTRQED